MLPSILPAFMPMIKKALPKLEPAIITYLQKYPPLPGEKGVTLMLDIDGEKAFIAVVGIDDKNTVVRIIHRERVSVFFEKLMKNINNP
jgi:hypothetical protein